jgi:hypothetical protein
MPKPVGSGCCAATSVLTNSSDTRQWLLQLRSCKWLSALPPLRKPFNSQPSYRNARILREQPLSLRLISSCGATTWRDAIRRLEAGAEVLADSLLQLLHMRFPAPLVCCTLLLQLILPTAELIVTVTLQIA